MSVFVVQYFTNLYTVLFLILVKPLSLILLLYISVLSSWKKTNEFTKLYRFVKAKLVDLFLLITA